jgi:hypothetical protein
MVVAEARSSPSREQEMTKYLYTFLVSKSIHTVVNILSSPFPFQPNFSREVANTDNDIYLPKILLSANEELLASSQQFRRPDWGAIRRDDPRIESIGQPDGLSTPPTCKCSISQLIYFLH